MRRRSRTESGSAESLSDALPVFHREVLFTSTAVRLLRHVVIYMEPFFAGLPPGASLALKVFFSVVELLIIGAGIYLFQQRKKLFAHIGQEGDTSASANL